MYYTFISKRIRQVNKKNAKLLLDEIKKVNVVVVFPYDLYYTRTLIHSKKKNEEKERGPQELERCKGERERANEPTGQHGILFHFRENMLKASFP